jgi:hypothetical protein
VLQESYAEETGILYYPTFIVEQSQFGYVVAFADDIFDCHSTLQLKRAECLHHNSSSPSTLKAVSRHHQAVNYIVAHVVKQEQLIVITALQDVIFVGLNFSQYDIHIKSSSRVGFVGGCRVKSLTVEAKSLKFGDLTLSYLSATADEFVSFDGSVHISSTESPLMKEPEIQNVMSKVSCGGNVLSLKGRSFVWAAASLFRLCRCFVRPTSVSVRDH